MGDDLMEFSVRGPFAVPLEPGKTGKMVAKDLSAFWEAVGDLQDLRGVYMFGIRAGKGIKPIYIGKTAKQTFRTEAFAHHKLAAHYNPALLDCKKGTAVMFFVAHPVQKGPINQGLIDKIESFLIDVASTKNRNLSNVKKKPDHKWRIRGVVRSKTGEATAATAIFKKAIGLGING